ncbi:hypothetical protein [Vreelandella sp. EE22]
MSVTHYLSIKFSRPRWRYALWVALVLHGVFGLYALGKELGLGLNLSLLINAVQFGLVQAALILLAITTNKQEKQRYSLDTRFYLNCYKKERHRFLALERETSGNLRALTGLDQRLNDAEVERLAKRDDLIVSQSVLEWLPDQALSVEDIEFHIQDDWYEMPWIIGEQGLDTILKRFNAIERYDYNGLTLAVHDWQASPDRFVLSFKKSFYYNYLATNMLPELTLPGGLSYRNLLEPGPALSPLSSALPENHLGLSCLIRTSDGGLIIPRRSQLTTVFKGQLSPSVSGAANLETCRDEQGNYSAHAWLMKELCEELPFIHDATELFEQPIAEIARKTQFLGMTRELRRCGKPELFMFLPLEITTQEVFTRWEHYYQDADNRPSITSLHGIDHNENSGLLVVEEQQLFERLKTRCVVRPGRGPMKEITEFHTTLDADGHTDILSESLVANLILYRYHQQSLKDQAMAE